MKKKLLIATMTMVPFCSVQADSAVDMQADSHKRSERIVGEKYNVGVDYQKPSERVIGKTYDDVSGVGVDYHKRSERIVGEKYEVGVDYQKSPGRVVDERHDADIDKFFWRPQWEISVFGGGGSFGAATNMRVDSADNYFSSADDVFFDSQPEDPFTRGFGIGGGGVGWYLESDRYTVGALIDGSSMNFTSTSSRTEVYPGVPQTYTLDQSLEMRGFGTFRGLVGVNVGSFPLFDSVRPYVTGGYAVTQAKLAASFTDEFGASNVQRETQTLSGWVIGAGLRLEPKGEPITLTFEYLHAGFGDISMQNSTPFVVGGIYRPNNVFTYEANDLEADMGRIKVSYRFDLGSGRAF